MNRTIVPKPGSRLRPGLRVLLASGYPASELASDHRAGEHGEFAFLKKPYRGAELAEKLRVAGSPLK